MTGLRSESWFQIELRGEPVNEETDSFLVSFSVSERQRERTDIAGCISEAVHRTKILLTLYFFFSSGYSKSEKNESNERNNKPWELV
jgi:hypothetical protein